MKLTLKLSEVLSHIAHVPQVFTSSKQQKTETLPSDDASLPPPANSSSAKASAVADDHSRSLEDGEDVDGKERQLEDKEDGGSEERQTWDNPTEFLMSCISMSVGLGNVWRFPFTAYENGGGAFIIPYLIVLLLIGRPLYMLELSIGQFSSSGCVKLWDMAPGFRGIGYGQSLVTFIVCSYYCVLIGISCYYLFASFQSVLPWTVCHPDLQEVGTVCLPSSSNRSLLNLTSSDENITLVASSEQYFQKGVLKGISDISDGIGLPDAGLVGCLLLCWFFVYLTLRKGVSSSGKVAYFTAIFPYVVMFTLLGKGLTLPGAMDGIKFLFVPQWEMLLEPRVWYAAVTQSFFSLSVGFGCVITFSSYNKFEHNIYRDATIISCMDTFTSILAGVITFSILGHLAHELDLPISHVIKSGTSLAFITFPEVVAKFEFAPQLFAVLFFLMMITLGMGSAVGYAVVVVTVLKDAVPSLSKSAAAGIVCLLGAVSGIVFTTPGGQPLLELVDYYGGSLLVLVMCLSEVLVLTWVYGRDKIVRDLNFMLGRELGYYWKFCWFYFIPITITCILSYSLVFYKPVEYAHIALPLGAQLVGWTIFILGVLTILGFLVAEFMKFHLNHKQLNKDDKSPESWRLRKDRVVGAMFRPLESWGPSGHLYRSRWLLNLGINSASVQSRPKLDIQTISKNVLNEDKNHNHDFYYKPETP